MSRNSWTTFCILPHLTASLRYVEGLNLTGHSLSANKRPLLSSLESQYRKQSSREQVSGMCSVGGLLSWSGGLKRSRKRWGKSVVKVVSSETEEMSSLPTWTRCCRQTFHFLPRRPMFLYMKPWASWAVFYAGSSISSMVTRKSNFSKKSMYLWLYLLWGHIHEGFTK
jgi:hypothetical protein